MGSLKDYGLKDSASLPPRPVDAEYAEYVDCAERSVACGLRALRVLRAIRVLSVPG